MPKIAYDSAASIAQHAGIVRAAELICQEYARAGYSLTLRGLYYRFVARDLFPPTRRWIRKGDASDQWIKADPDDPQGTTNATPNYKWLGNILNDARLAGLIDWSHLVDQTRAAAVPYHWDSPAQLIESTAAAYSIDLWSTQPRRVEVWVEKDALQSIVDRETREWDCASFACKGYVSASAMWEAAQRIHRYHRRGQGVTILHLGDHDPSGIDMTRDITDRLTTMVSHDNASRGLPYPDDDHGDGRPWLEIGRIALNMDQIEEYNPPPNPAKVTDSRAEGYIAEYGTLSWELDALDPPVMAALVREAIAEIIDRDLYNERVTEQESDRAMLTEVQDRWRQINQRWPEIRDLLDGE